MFSSLRLISTVLAVVSTLGVHCAERSFFYNGILPPVLTNFMETEPESTNDDLDPEADMDPLEMIRYNGYPGEEYDITTEDGYILSVQRIPYGRAGPGDKPRQPVIVQHGMLACSIVWIFNTPANSLGFILADSGYDVWLPNIRGSLFGRRHVSLDPDKRDFWNFSFDEMGRYDMPAIIDFIINKTGYSQVNYIGHSMATTLAFVMLSEKPEYNDKIRCAIMMAPTISTQHIRNLSRFLKPFMRQLQVLANRFGSFEVMTYTPFSKFVSVTFSKVCHSRFEFVCWLISALIDTEDMEYFDMMRSPVYIGRLPSGMSLFTAMHYGQIMVPGSEFRRYDHGRTKNLEVYGQPEPPKYNMNNVTVPVAIFWGPMDKEASPEDVSLFVPKIRNLILNYRVPRDTFSHIDFVVAKDAKTLVYDKVLKVLKNPWLMSDRNELQ